MSRDTDAAVKAMAGAAALPRRNGELVFEAPWQGRAFGIGVALCRRGLYEWKEFQASLIRTIGAERADPDDARTYYEHWTEALERLLVRNGVLRPEEIERRAAEIRSGERDEVY